MEDEQLEALLEKLAEIFAETFRETEGFNEGTAETRGSGKEGCRDQECEPDYARVTCGSYPCREAYRVRCRWWVSAGGGLGGMENLRKSPVVVCSNLGGHEHDR